MVSQNFHIGNWIFFAISSFAIIDETASATSHFPSEAVSSGQFDERGRKKNQIDLDA